MKIFEDTSQRDCDPSLPPWVPSRRQRVRTLISVLVVALSGATVGMGMAATGAPPAGADNWAPVRPGDFADPSILFWNGIYYGFATQNFATASQTINVQVSTSSDGVNWSSTSTDALPSLGTWAEPGETWAPSVAFNGTEFVMYYTANDILSGDECIGEATASSALGPYSDNNPSAVICQTGAGGSIDPDIFTDPQSHGSYLLWKNDGNRIGAPTGIWSAPLSPDLLSVTGSASDILGGADEPWQSGIIEGPDMVSVSGAYYLFYSGGSFGANTYALGWASCAGPSGPCTDRSTSPLLSSSPGMSGPGGPDVFDLPGGQVVVAFAAWQGTTVGYLSCGLRPFYEASLTFDDATSPPTPVLGDPNPDGPAAGSPSCPPPPEPPPGYWQVGSDGGVFTYGAAQFYGSTGSMKLNKPIVGMAAGPEGKGYWLVASDGGIFAYGDAQFYGSMGSMALNSPIIAMIATLDGGGYWLIAADGGVFTFGDAKFYGSLGGHPPRSPITAAALGFLGGGYWMVDANGQVFNFGDAPNEGSPSSAPGGYAISGMTPTHNDQGYWLSSRNGNVADLGDAVNHGSMYGANLDAPIVGIAATHDAGGYWLQGADGGIFSFGDAPFLGSMGGQHLNAAMVGITSV